jgi:hypothetical protein
MGSFADRFSPKMVFLNVDSSGLETESDYPGRENAGHRAALATRHPFFRNERFRDEPPRVIRFLWNPQSGDALLGASGRHADVLRRYAGKKRRVTPFREWLRGFYFPRTGKLVARPFDVAAIGRDGDWAFSDRMQRHVRRIVERQLKRKIPNVKFHMNVDNEWLTSQYGGRW